MEASAPPDEQTELLVEAVEKFLTDHASYTRECLKIRDKDAALRPMELNFAQRYVHQKLQAQWHAEGRVRAIVLKARQEGVSTYTASRFFRRMQFMANQEAVVIADELSRGGKLFEIYERFYTHLPEMIRPQKRSARMGKTLWFDNPNDTDRLTNPGLDSKVAVLTAGDQNVGRASTIQMLHLSEVAFWEKGEDAWVSLMQAVPDNGTEIVVESTANGIGNLFHQMWLDAESGASDFIAIFLPWWIQDEYSRPLTDAARADLLASLDILEPEGTHFESEALERGILWEGEYHKLRPEQLAWRRDVIRNKMRGDVQMFKQEYPSTSREAFIVTGNVFFDQEALLEYEQAARPPKHRGNLTWVDDELGKKVEFKPSEKGYLRIWEKPAIDPKTGKFVGHYVISADPAEGKMISAAAGSAADPENERGGRDFSSADVLRVDTREIVAQLHGRMAPDIFADQLQRLGHFYACPGNDEHRAVATIAVENNHGSGATCLARLKEVHEYPALYIRRIPNQQRTRKTREYGWHTDAKTRPMMLDELEYEVRTHTISIPNPKTIEEMFSFVRGDDGKPAAQEGAHDDRVISAAIALQAAKHHYCPTGGMPPEYQASATPTGWGDAG